MMASRITRTPVTQLQRHLSAQASALKKTHHHEKLETSILPSGLTVATVDAPGSGASLGVLVRAGSKYETSENYGVGHCLRIAAGLASKSHTSFAIVRNLQQIGAGLNCSQGREYMLYSSHFTKNNLDNVVDFFFEAATCPNYKPWELSDNKGRMALEIAELSNEAKATELLHKAAYRNGLGNSLYSPVHMIGKHKVEMVDSFFKSHFTTTRAILVGVGIDHKTLCGYADLAKLGKGTVADVPGKYYGGELRSDVGGKHAVINIAAETSGMANPKEAVACRILQHVLGTGPHIPYGNGYSPLCKAVSAKVGNDAEAAVSAINYGYADSGLLGAIVIAEKNWAGKVVGAVAEALRTINVSDAEFKAAKNALTIQLAEEGLNASKTLEEVGLTGILRHGAPLSDSDKIDMVSLATLADVQAVAKKIASSKLAMSAVGNLSTVPYLDSL